MNCKKKKIRFMTKGCPRSSIPQIITSFPQNLPAFFFPGLHSFFFIARFTGENMKSFKLSVPLPLRRWEGPGQRHTQRRHRAMCVLSAAACVVIVWHRSARSCCFTQPGLLPVLACWQGLCAPDTGSGATVAGGAMD